MLEEHMTEYDDQVERLFAEANDRHEKIRRNPVTGGAFVPDVDPVAQQKWIAVKALQARDWFASQKPPDIPDLPLTYGDRERMKVGGISHIVAWLARSLAGRGYETKDHPGLDEYARGVMASPSAPGFIRNDPELLKRYPPRSLPGLGRGLGWDPPK
jgi:hypothetical protein